MNTVHISDFRKISRSLRKTAHFTAAPDDLIFLEAVQRKLLHQLHTNITQPMDMPGRSAA